VAWLNQFASRRLTDSQRVALVYLRHNERMTNSDYRRLNRVDSVVANRELRRLVQEDLIEQHGTRRWTEYTLAVPVEAPAAPAAGATAEEKILAYVKKHGWINNAKCREELKVDVLKASYLLKKIHRRGLLKREGERRWARYVLP
jgi:predicted HTH transcriptional regulator